MKTLPDLQREIVLDYSIFREAYWREPPTEDIQAFLRELASKVGRAAVEAVRLERKDQNDFEEWQGLVIDNLRTQYGLFIGYNGAAQSTINRAASFLGTKKDVEPQKCPYCLSNPCRNRYVGCEENHPTPKEGEASEK